MGKVRDHIKDDAAALAQWMARKCWNHDPMSVRVKAKSRRAAKDRTMHTEGTNEVIYETDDGKKFKLSVEQLA